MDDSQSSGKPLRPQAILDSLTYAKPVITRLKGQGKDYDALIDEVLTMPVPFYGSIGIKPLYTKFGISPTRLTKWIRELYLDFKKLIEDEACVMSFDQVKVMVRPPELNECIYCHLPFLPRIGESVHFSFLWAELENGPRGTLYVKSIEHYYENGVTTSLIVTERLPPYVSHLKDRAIFDKKLDEWSANRMPKDELEDFLHQLYGGQAKVGVASRLYQPEPYYRNYRRRKKEE